MRFSVAIPSYNSEKYINELLNSLVKQTFNKDDFEVIVIDDCSTDNTLEIVNSYKDKLNLIVNQLERNSGGPGKPRNEAIKLAQGEFIFFVDSDDYINKHTLKDVDKFLQKKYSEVILVKMEGVNGRGVPQSMFSETRESVTIENSRIIYTLSPTKFYNRSLLVDNNIFFPEELKSAEDQLFTMKAYVHAKNISILADKSYYYATKREGEHMSSAYVNPKDFYEIMRLIVEEIKNSNLNNKMEILALFIDRHFSFSRTKNFSLNVKNENLDVWMSEISSFINTIPLEVDEKVPASLVPLLKYGRENDFENYQLVEKSYKNNIYHNIKTEGSKILVQFSEDGPYFDVSNLNKPDIKMTKFEINEDHFNIKVQLLKSIINPADSFSNVNLKLISRNKKEKIVIPMTIADKNTFTFKSKLEDFIEYGINEKIWDLFFEVKIEGINVEKRIGKNRVKYQYKPETSAIVNHNDQSYRITPYFTKDFDNLSFYVTTIDPNDEFKGKIKNSNVIEIKSKNRGYIFNSKIVNVNYNNENILGYLQNTSDVFTYNLHLYSKVKKNMFNNQVVVNINGEDLYIK